MKVLVCDDTEIQRKIVRHLLKVFDCEIIEASNGAEGVDMYKLHKPDIVIMDITMPVMDGLTATRLIRTYDPKAKIIICSAMGQDFFQGEAANCGAVRYIVKPAKAEVLRSLVMEVYYTD